jgi:uncharacterized protein YbjQ (UPF0145 family)
LSTRLAPTVFLGAIASSGCVNVSTTPFGDIGPAVSPDSVQVFATRVPAEYKEVAILRADRVLANDKKVLAALRREAAKLGANGILLINLPNSGTRQHGGTGVIISQGKADVVAASGETTVDAFEKAVAIRVVKP